MKSLDLFYNHISSTYDHEVHPDCIFCEKICTVFHVFIHRALWTGHSKTQQLEEEHVLESATSDLREYAL